MGIADLLGLAATVIGLGTASAAAFRYGSRTYTRTLGSRRSLQRALNQIGPGVTMRHVESLLGPPVYCRAERPEEGATLTFESIFFTRHAYVQIVHTEHDEVVAFGVTTFDPDFRPTIRQVPPVARDERTVRLGATRFGDLVVEPDSIWLHSGPYRSHYNEFTYLGRSGRYLTFAFARNEAGCGAWLHPEGLGDLGQKTITELRELTDNQLASWRGFRDGTAINTVCVYSDQLTRRLCTFASPWRCGLDAEETPALLDADRGPIRRLRDLVHRPS